MHFNTGNHIYIHGKYLIFHFSMQEMLVEISSLCNMYKIVKSTDINPPKKNNTEHFDGKLKGEGGNFQYFIRPTKLSERRQKLLLLIIHCSWLENIM